jgi:chitin disaccharide deacetylase
MKWLIVTADDFGISRGINRGIVEAHLSGVVTSTSLMVDRPACEEAVALARRCPKLSLGLHLELEGVSPENVPVEIERQQTRFVELVGSAPTHVDTHHDVHRDPEVLAPLLAWGWRTRVPVRGHSEVRYSSKFYGQWGGETHLEQIGFEALLRLLDEEIGEGMTELNCHPGHPEPDFPSSYAAERVVEVRTLCHPELRPAILERGFRLIGFRDLYRPGT